MILYKTKRRDSFIPIMLILCFLSCDQSSHPNESEAHSGGQPVKPAAAPVDPSPANPDDLDLLMDQVDQSLAQTSRKGQPIQQAIATLDQILMQSPGHGYAKRLKGALLLQIKEVESAVLCYEEYLSQFPRDSNTRLNLAGIYSKMNLLEKSELHLKKVIEAWPGTWKSCELMAEISTLCKKPEVAEKYSKLATQLKAEGKPASPSIVILPKYLSPKRASIPQNHPVNHLKTAQSEESNSKLKSLKEFVGGH